MTRALWRVRSCPEQAGAALGRTIETMGALSDTVELQRRTWLTQNVVDDRIIVAAAGVAKGQANSPEARMYALRTLIWQKAPGHRLAVAVLADAPPESGQIAAHSSYTNHYYTDLGYGTGEHPWPVLGKVPGDDYVDQLDRLVSGIQVAPADEGVNNVKAWFLRFDQDPQLTQLLDAARRESGQG